MAQARLGQALTRPAWAAQTGHAIVDLRASRANARTRRTAP